MKSDHKIKVYGNFSTGTLIVKFASFGGGNLKTVQCSQRMNSFTTAIGQRQYIRDFYGKIFFALPCCHGNNNIINNQFLVNLHFKYVDDHVPYWFTRMMETTYCASLACYGSIMLLTQTIWTCLYQVTALSPTLPRSQLAYIGW